MTDARANRIEDLFDRALDRPEPLREPWLRDECAGDESLLREVLSLLEAHERSSTFLDRPALEQSPDLAAAFDPVLGSTVGSYRVVERIGTGGMGSVYLAERIDETFDRRVAIKLIRRGLNTTEILERFDRERRVLANLNHPNIAALIDAGTLPDGSPYFVMEYVQGTRFDHYCDDHRLTISERIDLFRTVCDAVAHAHRNLVIHRDLKPANILVTDDGTVKLLDFGVAKVLDTNDGQQHTESTITVERRLTPAYASPEQIRGEPVTTSSDVYSLGVILYELLTGSRPYRVDSDSWRELEQAICDAQPTRPSAAVVSPRTTTDTLSTSELSRRRGVEPARLRHLLRGDVEWVVLMALRKEPSRRYATVQQLSEDLRRISASLPVLARPDTLSYRASRFVRRNRAGVTWAALLAVSLIGASAVSVHLAISESQARSAEAEQRRVAEAERDRAIAAESRSQQRAEELEQVASFQANQFEAIDIEQMGQRILSQILASSRLASELSGISPERAQQIEAELQRSLDGINFANVARDAVDEAVFTPAQRAIDERFSDQPLVHARLLESVAQAMETVGMIQPAISNMQRVGELRRVHAGPQDQATLDALLQLGNLRNKIGDTRQAERDLHEALAGFESVLGPNSQRSISTRSALGAVAQAQGDIARAESYYETALRLAREHLGSDHETTLAIINNLAFLTLDAGQLDEAEPYFIESFERSRDLYGEDDLATVRRVHALGLFRARQGRYNEAHKLLTEAYEAQRAAYGDEHPNVVVSMIELARTLQRLNRSDEADALAKAAYDAALTLADNHRSVQQALNIRGSIAMNRRDYAAAEAFVREELDRHIRQHGPDHARVSTTQGNLALILFRSGRADEAETMLREAHAAQVIARGESHPMTLSLLNNLAGIVRAQGHLDEAAEFWERAYAGRKAALGPDHHHTLQTLRHLVGLSRQRGLPLERHRWLDELVQTEADQAGTEPARAPSAPQLADACYQAGHYEQALELALRFRELKLPMNVSDLNTIRYLEGDALLALGRFKEAETVYLRFNRQFLQSSQPHPEHAAQLYDRLGSLYRAWFESSGNPEHRSRAEQWEQRSRETLPTAQRQ